MRIVWGLKAFGGQMYHDLSDKDKNMNNYARYFFLGMMLYLLAVHPAGAQTQTIINQPHHHAISSDIYKADRFQIIETPAADKNIFRFDRICGGIELLVSNGQAWTWSTLQVPDLFPCINDGRSHYQLFASAQGDLVLLMNTDTKTTWRFDVSSMSWLHM